MPAIPKTSPGSVKPRRGIQSVEVGGRLLQALANEHRALALKDLAAAADMSASQAHTYLVSFAKLGLVRQVASSGLYELGPFALQLGLAALARLEPVRLATPWLAQLGQQMDQTVFLTVWGNAGPTVVRIEESRQAIHVNMRTGTVMSLSNTATGRVFAAWLPTVQWSALLKRERKGQGMQREFGPPLQNAELDAMVNQIRSTGVSRALGRPIPGLNALAAPCFDHLGQLALVVSVLGPAESLDVDEASPATAQVRACATSISAELGWRGAPD